AKDAEHGQGKGGPAEDEETLHGNGPFGLRENERPAFPARRPSAGWHGSPAGINTAGRWPVGLLLCGGDSPASFSSSLPSTGRGRRRGSTLRAEDGNASAIVRSWLNLHSSAVHFPSHRAQTGRSASQGAFSAVRNQGSGVNWAWGSCPTLHSCDPGP